MFEKALKLLTCISVIFIIKQNLLIKRKGYFCRETVDTIQSETFSSWQVKKIKCIDARALNSICLMRLLKSKLQNEWQDKYRKIPKISPGAYIFQMPFLRGLFLEELILGGAYLRREICVSNSFGLAL